MDLVNLLIYKYITTNKHRISKSFLLQSVQKGDIRDFSLHAACIGATIDRFYLKVDTMCKMQNHSIIFSSARKLEEVLTILC